MLHFSCVLKFEKKIFQFLKITVSYQKQTYLRFRKSKCGALRVKAISRIAFCNKKGHNHTKTKRGSYLKKSIKDASSDKVFILCQLLCLFVPFMVYCPPFIGPSGLRFTKINFYNTANQILTSLVNLALVSHHIMTLA
jgi:hypothetical protein